MGYHGREGAAGSDGAQPEEPLEHHHLGLIISSYLSRLRPETSTGSSDALGFKGPSDAPFVLDFLA